MAQRAARINVGIWTEPTFRALSEGAQWVYLMLLSQMDLASDQTIALRPRRWARYARNLTPEAICTDLDELAATGFARVDYDLQEVQVIPFEFCDRRGHTVTAFRPNRGTSPATRRQPRPDMPASIRRLIYERDGFACQHCSWSPGRPASYDGKNALFAVVGTRRALVARGAFDKPDVYEDRDVVRYLAIDHIHPLSAGGAFKDLTNLQALCSDCNGRKGAKV